MYSIHKHLLFLTIGPFLGYHYPIGSIPNTHNGPDTAGIINFSWFTLRVPVMAGTSLKVQWLHHQLSRTTWVPGITAGSAAMGHWPRWSASHGPAGRHSHLGPDLRRPLLRPLHARGHQRRVAVGGACEWHSEAPGPTGRQRAGCCRWWWWTSKLTEDWLDYY